MHLRFTSAHAVAFGCLAAVASCFPDPLPDNGIPDSGIFVPEGGTGTNDASVNGLTVSATALDFGLADCGGNAPANQTVTITNVSAGEVSYALLASGVGFAVVSPATGKIPAGGHIDVALSAAAVSAFATAGGANEGSLQIITNAPGQKSYAVGLKETAAGGQIVVTPDVADFGVTTAVDPRALDIPIKNFGNKPVKVTVLSLPMAGYALTQDGAASDGTVTPGQALTLHAKLTGEQSFEPEFIGDYKVEGTLCGGQTSGATSHYTIRSQVTYSGYPTISPGVLSFDMGGTGFTPCGQKAAAKTLTVSNPIGGEYTNVSINDLSVVGPFTVSPAFDPMSPIAITDGSPQTITVTPTLLAPPQSTTPGGASGALHVALSNGTEYTVQLYQTAQGAFFALTPSPSLAFGDVPVDNGSVQLLSITNAGNAPARATLAIAGSPYFVGSPNAPFSVNTPAGTASIGFFPLAAGKVSATVSFAADGAVCGLPSPATIDLSGNGVATATS
ncbi:MAG: hypothetical protein ABI551_05090, partial [Polyangiaceae bacterium]